MKDFRDYITAKPDEFLELIRTTEEAVQMSITADLYKRPKPTDNPDLTPYFAWKGNISCIIHEDFSENTFGPELAQRVRSFFEKLIPIYDYFCRFKV